MVAGPDFAPALCSEAKCLGSILPCIYPKYVVDVPLSWASKQLNGRATKRTIRVSDCRRCSYLNEEVPVLFHIGIHNRSFFRGVSICVGKCAICSLLRHS